MLTIQLNGGLGNQLFQYALGKSLSDRFDVRYDTSHLAHAFTARSCELGFFQTKGDFGPHPKTNDQTLLSERQRYYTIADKLHFPATRYQYHKIDIKDNTYIQGFWQSYKYFDHIRDSLLTDIVSVQDLDSQNQLLMQQMHNENSVAIHIRRGDFQKTKRSTIHMRGKHWHTIVGLDYYHKAIEYIKISINKPVFYIFSNDIEWCKGNFMGAEFRFVEGNTGLDSYKDMILMSQCKHNIICNSTFSRRGAYLNQNKDALVVSPKKWYDVAIGIGDLLLPSWLVL